MCYCVNSFISLFIRLLLVLDFPLFNRIHFYSVPSDSKLHVSYCKKYSVPPIYKKEMEKKINSSLTDEEVWDENHIPQFILLNRYLKVLIKKKLKKINEQNIKIKEQLRDKHNDRIKNEEGWDPEGEKPDPLIPTVKGKQERDSKFLSDEESSIGGWMAGSIDERQDRGKLGELVATNKPEKSSDAASSVDTTKKQKHQVTNQTLLLRLVFLIIFLIFLMISLSSLHLLPYIDFNGFGVVFQYG